MERIGIDNRVLAVQPFYRRRNQACTSEPKTCRIRYLSLPGGLGLSTAGTFLFSSILPAVRRLHDAETIDLIHAHAPLPCGHAAMFLNRELGLPYVVTVHGLDAFSHNQVGGWAGNWCRNITRALYESAESVICISEQVRQRVLAGASCTTTVVYNGVDTRMFSPTSNDVAPDTILSVGNLIPIKGHELLLRAFANISSDFPRLSCELIGDGPERSHLTSLAAKLNIADRVRFLGRQSRKQVAEAMRRCAVFALPSRYEGLGCVYLEAMCAGKPVIACRGQGIEEVIQHGVNGWLVGTNDMEELKDALSRLLTNVQLRRQIGDAAHRTIMHGFTLAHQAERLVQVYRECMI
jgi:teichuronic acid biosynthesis glycosyltransferase TuaC